MTPYAQVCRDWMLRPRDFSLPHYEAIYKRSGYMFVTPAVYVLCRPVKKYAPDNHILDDAHVFEPATCDCWFVMQVTGDMRAALRLMPFELPWMCWVRDHDDVERLRFYETARLQRAIGNQ